jgi:hypothetical protein
MRWDQRTNPEVRQPIYALGSSKVRENPSYAIISTVEHKNTEHLGQDLDRRLLEIGRKVDPHHEQVTDMYAEEIAGDFLPCWLPGHRCQPSNRRTLRPQAGFRQPQ